MNVNFSELSTDDLYQLCILAGQSRSQKVKKTGAYRRLPYSAFLFGLNALRIVLLEETVCGYVLRFITEAGPKQINLGDRHGDFWMEISVRW